MKFSKLEPTLVVGDSYVSKSDCGEYRATKRFTTWSSWEYQALFMGDVIEVDNEDAWENLNEAKRVCREHKKERVKNETKKI